MKRLGVWLLYAVLGVGFLYGGARLSMRVLGEADPNISTDPSTMVPAERASGPPPGYEPPAPGDTPCLQPENATRCVGRARARTGLMRLAGLQQERMRTRGSYADDAAALGFQIESGMELRMSGGSAGWTAEYHHVAGAVGCAIYEGALEEPFTTVGGLLSATPGAVACDDPLASGR